MPYDSSPSLICKSNTRNKSKREILARHIMVVVMQTIVSQNRRLPIRRRQNPLQLRLNLQGQGPRKPAMLRGKPAHNPEVIHPGMTLPHSPNLTFFDAPSPIKPGSNFPRSENLFIAVHLRLSSPIENRRTPENLTCRVTDIRIREASTPHDGIGIEGSTIRESETRSCIRDSFCCSIILRGRCRLGSGRPWLFGGRLRGSLP